MTTEAEIEAAAAVCYAVDAEVSVAEARNIVARFRHAEHSGDCTKDAWSCIRCAVDANLKLARAALEAAAAVRWQPIETAPKDRSILGYHPTGRPDGKTLVAKVRWSTDLDRAGLWQTVGSWRSIPEGSTGYTHWMPLPHLPSTTQGE